MLLGRCSEMPRLALLIECWENLTNKRTTRKTKTKTMTNTFREHLQRATFEIFYLRDMWSEWWENMTMTNKIRKTNTKTMMMTKAFREHHQRGIFEDFRKYPQMAISEKFWVWLLIHCFEFKPFQTKLIWVWFGFAMFLLLPFLIFLHCDMHNA